MRNLKHALVTLGLAVAATNSIPALAQTPVGTAFTYQGRLKINGVLHTGTADLCFKLYNAANAGSLVTGPGITNPVAGNGVEVSKCLFSTPVNFGLEAFVGDARWIEISVRTTAGPADCVTGYTSLGGRQPINPAPYAVRSIAPWESDAVSGDLWYTGGDVAIGNVTPPEQGSARFIVDEPTRGAIVGRAHGDSVGVLGQAEGGGGTGVFGQATSTSDSGIGVQGESSSPTGYGGLFRSNHIGVYGGAQASGGTGVYGQAELGSGTGIGVRGESGSPNGWAGWFGGRCYFGGNVGIGATDPTSRLVIVGADNAGPQLVLQNPNIGSYSLTTDDLGNFRLRYPGNGGLDRIWINPNGYVGINFPNPTVQLQVGGNIAAACGLLSCSDRRFKTDIVPLRNALAIANAIEPVRFRWQTEAFPDRHFSDGPQIGFIAQDIRNVLPEVVLEGSDGYLSVDYSRLTPVLVEAVKELHGMMQHKDAQLAVQASRIDQQQRELDDLRVEMTQMRQMIERLARGTEAAKP